MCKIPPKRHHWKSRRDIWSKFPVASARERATFFQFFQFFRSQGKPLHARENCHDRILITCARKFVTVAHHAYMEIFLSVFRIMCAWALSFSQMPCVMCAGSFTTFSRLRPDCHKARSRPARSCTADDSPPRPDPRGARDTSSLWRAKVRGSRLHSERSLKTGADGYVKNGHVDFIKGRPAAYVKNTGGDFAKGPVSHLSNYSK